jgi:hypothetical protein
MIGKMQTSESKTFAFVKHHQVEEYKAKGWKPHDSLNGTGHGQYSTLMEAPHTETCKVFISFDGRDIGECQLLSDRVRDFLTRAGFLVDDLSPKTRGRTLVVGGL